MKPSRLAQELARCMITNARHELDPWLTFQSLRPALEVLLDEQLDRESGDRAEQLSLPILHARTALERGRS